MAQNPADDGRSLQRMFGGIAGRYELLNHLITFGRDTAWRRQCVRILQLKQGDRLLDVGCGTGDMARAARNVQPACHIVACDFTYEMVARAQEQGSQADWLLADAEHLPFAKGSFEAACSGFLLRNVRDIVRGLKEQHRVLKAGGRVASLDTSPQGWRLLEPFRQFHLNVVIPWLGKRLTGDYYAYHYLPATTKAFLSPESLAATFQEAGFSDAAFMSRMFGNIAIHWGSRM